jgi:hypothetical protein
MPAWRAASRHNRQESKMKNQPPEQAAAQPKLAYLDRIDIAETFVDSVARVTFDGATLRVEFAVNRAGDQRQPGQGTGRAVTACRLVMPASGMLDLFGRLSALMNALQQQGVLKTTPPETAPAAN